QSQDWPTPAFGFGRTPGVSADSWPVVQQQQTNMRLSQLRLARLRPPNGGFRQPLLLRRSRIPTEVAQRSTGSNLEGRDSSAFMAVLQGCGLPKRLGRTC